MAEFNFLTNSRPSMKDVNYVLNHFKWHLSAIFILMRPNCDIGVYLIP